MSNETCGEPTLRITFDEATVQLDALQRAVYAVADVMTVDITRSDGRFVCSLYARNRAEDDHELAHRLRTEVIDQTLRIRIADQTEPLRNLIFALAFSQTGLGRGRGNGFMTTLIPRQVTAIGPGSWELLPLRFHRFDDGVILLTNLVGEQVFVSEAQFLAILDGTCTDQGVLAELRAKHLSPAAR